MPARTRRRSAAAAAAVMTVAATGLILVPGASAAPGGGGTEPVDVTCNGQAATILVSALPKNSRNNIYGTPGDDVIVVDVAGLSVNVWGGDGNDSLCVNADSDFQIIGGPGDDYLASKVPGIVAVYDYPNCTGPRCGNGNGDPKLKNGGYGAAKNGQHFFDGGDGNDTIRMGPAEGFSEAHGGPGNDTIWSSLGGFSRSTQTVTGDDGDDVLYGAGTTVWKVLNFNETYGVAPDATLDGGAGADRVVGGVGADVLTGGADNDVIESDETGSWGKTRAADTVDGGLGFDDLTLDPSDVWSDAGGGVNVTVLP